MEAKQQTEKDVRFWSKEIQDLNEKLNKWREENPNSTGEEQKYQILEKSLDEANKHLKEARTYHLQLIACQKPPEQTVGHKRIQDDEWFTQNMITKKLKTTEYEQMDSEDEEDIEFYRTKYFEMPDFPPMAHKTPQQKKVIERKCYVVILEQLMKKIKECLENGTYANLIVTGNPGTGKSCFYLYCIYRFIRDQELIGGLPSFQLVINYGSMYHKYCFTSKQFFQLSEAEIDALQEEKNVIRLIEARSSLLTDWKGVSILFSSPGVTGMNEFIKADSTTYILPVWSFRELRGYNSLLGDDLGITDDVLNARHYKYGGIPSYIFEKDERLNEAEIENAIATFSGLELIKFIHAKKYVTEYHYSHRIFHMAPDKSDCRDKYHLDFLSKYIVEKLIENADEDSLQVLSKFVM